MVVIGSAHLRSAQASCVTIPGTSIICNNDNDPVNVTATTLTQLVDGGGGNDTIVIDSLSRVGNSSADTNHGVVGGTGQDSIINSGVVRGYIGIRDGDGLSTLPDIDEDYIENYGTIVSQDTGIMGGGGDLLINYNSIQANFGISCFFAAGSGCSIANYGRISAPSMAIQGSSLNDEVLNTSLIGNVGLYSGNDTLINLGPGRITGYVETGTGSDSVLNFATIDGVSGVNLGADADILINQGSTLYAANIASSVFGGNGNDTIINLNYGYIDGIDGGDGDDSLFNSSIVAG
ncbi:MAG: hypothetical protein NZM00_01040, partial [Anaerolinea sp.]|nr:hypothetical protein [Anaerolinea sp.]